MPVRRAGFWSAQRKQAASLFGAQTRLPARRAIQLGEKSMFRHCNEAKGWHRIYKTALAEQESHRRTWEKLSRGLLPPGRQGATSPFLERVDQQRIPCLPDCFNPGMNATVVS